jgi:hypothetical protein
VPPIKATALINICRRVGTVMASALRVSYSRRFER